MDSSPLNPSNNQSFQNLGMPVTGNTGSRNPLNLFGGRVDQGSDPFSLNPVQARGMPGSIPLGGGIISGQPPMTPAGGFSGFGGTSPLGPGSIYNPGGLSPFGGLNQGSGYSGPGGSYTPNVSTSPLSSNPAQGGLLGTTPIANPPSPYAGLITSGGTAGGYSGTGTQSVPSPYGNLGSQQQQTLANQLGKIYGVGVGSLLSSTLANLGSADNSYMQAYGAAMAPINAQNMNTLMTTMGNQGIGGNSSTAALAQGDFWSNVTSQEGLQEAGLQQQSMNALLGLEGAMMPTAAKERTQGGILNYLGQMMQGIGNMTSGSGLKLPGSGSTSGGGGGAISDASLSDPSADYGIVGDTAAAGGDAAASAAAATAAGAGLDAATAGTIAAGGAAGEAALAALLFA